MNPLKKKHRDDKSLLQGARILLTLAVAIGVLFSSAPTADGFIAFDHFNPRVRRKMNNLIRRVHKEQWVIGYAYADPEWGHRSAVCPPEARNNGEAIEEVITQALNAWLQPVRDLNTGKPVVSDFRFVPNFEVRPKDLADLLLYDLRIFFFCEFEISRALVGVDMAIPPALNMRRGTDVNPRFSGALLHELGHAFGLLDTYIILKREKEELRVSRGGLARTIGHQPASVMAGGNTPRPIPTRVSQDDANGIVWLYKFYHENLPLEDCIFPDYELETSPDGCRPKSPLIFEIKHGTEWLAIKVIDEDRNTDVNTKDENGMTALHYAAEKDYQLLVARLLRQDIDVNVRNAVGSTALFWAAKRGSYGVVEKLLKHKAIDVNIKGAGDATPLKAAATEENDRIVELLLEQEPRESDWTAVDATSWVHHRSVFYLLHAPLPQKREISHVGYLGTVLGEGGLFIAQHREDASIEEFLRKGTFTLVGYDGVVAEDIDIRKVASFPSADGKTESVLLSIKDIDFSGYLPLPLSADPILTETDVEVLTYKFGSGVVLEKEDADQLHLPLRMRECLSVPHVELGAKGLWQHTCGPPNSVASGSLLFDKKEGTLIGFYTQQEADGILGDGLPLANVISEALIHLVDAKPVNPKNRLTTTWAALKAKE